MSLKKLSVLLPTLASVFVLLINSSGQASVLSDNNVISLGIDTLKELSLLGATQGISNHFEIADSKYLNIVLDSSEIIEARIESVPNMILMHIESDPEANSSNITISNLKPLTTYYLYQDSHHNLTVIISDINGSYAYTQDITSRHLVFIKPEPSTKYISDNSTGGDCTSIGTWNPSTKTCTFTTNLTETVEISSNGITLNGDGHSIIKSGSMTGYGVFINGKNNVAIKDLTINNFSYGVYINSSINNTLTNNIASNNSNGIFVQSSDSTLIGNTANSNDNVGIFISSSTSNTITNNTASSNYAGISANNSTNNTFADNIVQENTSYDFFIGDCNNSVTSTTGSGGRPIKYFNSAVDLNNETLSELILCNADGSNLDNITIDGSLTKQNNGLLLLNTDYSTITNVNSSNNYDGIRLDSSSNNTITNSTANSNNINGYGGISIRSSGSTNNTLVDNTASNNYIGIYLASSSNSTITGNTINSNSNTGIWSSGSDNNTIANNIASDNLYGIGLGDSSNNTLTNNTISSSSNMGLFLGIANNNQIDNNNFITNVSQVSVINSSGNVFNLPLPTGGNYWSDHICVDSNLDKICDNPYSFSGGQDNYPWIIKDGWLGETPNLSNIHQYKSDSSAEISERGITTESYPGDTIAQSDPLKSIAIFSARVSDSQNDVIKLQVEVKPFSQSFDGLNLKDSDLIISGSIASVKSDPLSVNQYHWRARAIDIKGNTSVWQEFGTAGNVDFIVKLVPLYTQIFSEYPSEVETTQWTGEEYASGYTEEYDCGSTIAKCGCAMTSLVMLSRYHNLDIADYDDVVINPGILNSWLKSITLGYDNGNVNWPKIQSYSESVTGFVKLKYNGPKWFKDIDTLNEYVADNSNPVVAAVSGHFLVIDGKLGDTYTVKDPSWFETRSLNQLAVNSKQRNYNNNFNGLRLYTAAPTATTAAPSISGTLASPAEFLVTAPDGKKLGKDPINGLEYTEITDGVYYEEGIGNPEDISAYYHKVKRIWIPDPIDGQYDFKVIGTGEGEYAVSSTIFDSNGDFHSESFVGNTKTNVVTAYDFAYDSTTPANIDVSPEDQTAPTTTIFIAGTQVSGWYISGALVTLSAADNSGGVGIWKIEYSLDGGTTWSTYTDPFIPPDADNLEIRYRSEDYVGNIESYSSTTIDVDQTGPEVQVYFDTVDKKIKVDGVDNLSTPTVTQIDPLNYTITDHVGHTLELGFTYPISTYDISTTKKVYSISVRKIKYDNDYKFVPVNTLSFGIKTDLSNNIKLLEQDINVPTKFNVSGAYDGYGTKIVNQEGSDVQKEYLSGLVLIKIIASSSGLDFDY